MDPRKGFRKEVKVCFPSKIKMMEDDRSPDDPFIIYDRSSRSFEEMEEKFLNSSLFTANKENPDFWLEKMKDRPENVFPVTFE